MNVVEVENVVKIFGTQRAVDGVSFSVLPGEIFGMLGPNGAGKTTTIRIMLGLYALDAGKVSVFGGALNPEKLQRIGYMPEERGLYRDEPLEAVIRYLGRLKGLSNQDVTQRMTRYLEQLELSTHRKKKIKDLSKGMQQKAQLIATILHHPSLLVVDEPFSGLDPLNTQLVQGVFQELRQTGTTIVMCSHEMHRVEALCNRIALFNRGKVVLYGAVKEIRRQFARQQGGPARLVLRLAESATPPDLSQLAGVSSIEEVAHGWQLTLAPGTSPESILQELLARGEQVEFYEIPSPTLDDIFVQTVQTGNQGAADA